MRGRVCVVVLSAACLLTALGCSKSSPTSPSSSGGALSASVVAPRPMTPANNATVPNAAQPITLTVQNAVVTGSGGTTYTFEVATDAAFTTKVQTKDGIAEGSAGQTSVKLDALAAAKDYYWHVRASSGGTTGVFGTVYKLTVGPAIALGAPNPIAPLNGAQTAMRPTLRVANVTRVGTSGPISYTFEVSTAATFGSTIASGSVAEGTGETDFVPPLDLPSTGTLYWRATAIDVPSGVASAPSAVQSFNASVPSQAAIVAAKLGVTLWPGAQPPGATGHATMGSDWNVEPLVSFNGVSFMNPPIDELQIFDLLDRGFTPPDAIAWMQGNGYATQGVWYPGPSVIGFPYEYLAFINGQWDIVIRVGS